MPSPPHLPGPSHGVPYHPAAGATRVARPHIVAHVPRKGFYESAGRQHSGGRGGSPITVSVGCHSPQTSNPVLGRHWNFPGGMVRGEESRGTCVHMVVQPQKSRVSEPLPLKTRARKDAPETCSWLDRGRSTLARHGLCAPPTCPDSSASLLPSQGLPKHPRVGRLTRRAGRCHHRSISGGTALHGDLGVCTQTHKCR